MGVKYIHNTHDSTIICRISSDKNKVFQFENKKFDKRNNIMLANGYTEVSDADLALLEKESHAYTKFSERGYLVVTDTLPQDSMSSEQLVSALRSEIAALKKAVAAGGGKSDEQLAATVAEQASEIEQLKKELAEKEELHQKEIEEKQAEIDELAKQLADVTVATADGEASEPAGD